MRRLLTILLLAVAPAALADEPLAQDVRYAKNVDPWMVRLADGRELSVRYGESISWETVETWKRGRALRLEYSLARGLQLLDPPSGKRLKVIAMTEGEHPIDAQTRLAVARERITTLGIAAALGAAEQRWDREIERLQRALLAAASERQRPAFLEAHRRWLAYRDAQSSASTATFREKQGTIWPLVNGRQRIALRRSHARRLQALLVEIGP